jgi:predicted GTPase
MKNIVIVGAGGRDFHTFNVVFRNDPDVRVVAFTAAQIPNIDHRTYPAALAGPYYPDGIPIVPQDDLVDLIRRFGVDEVVFAYSDVAYADLMHLGAKVLAAGADFRLVGARASMLHARKPVVAVCATRTGCGKSQTSRAVARLLQSHGLRVALVRHPMPYGDLLAMRVQRFRTLEEIDASHPTIEEREEYELPVREGVAVYAGVDYADILALAEDDADVVLWDGGNNDLPFYAPDLMVVVADALRPGHELAYYPGEANVLMADVLVVNKVDTADPDDVDAEVAALRSLNPGAPLVLAKSPAVVHGDVPIAGRRVLVVEDGPTITHGGMPFGAGTVAANAAGAAELVDPRAYAVGALRGVFERFPHIGRVLPAMGYGDEQLRDLAATIAATPCDVVVCGTPIDLTAALASVGGIGHPMVHVTYDLDPAAKARLAELLGPFVDKWTRR